MNEQSREEKKGVLKEYLGAVNRYAPAGSFLVLCLMLGFFAGSNGNDRRTGTRTETLNPRYQHHMEINKTSIDYPLEEKPHSVPMIEKKDYKLDKSISEIIWDKELATPKDFLNYAVKEKDENLCEYIIALMNKEEELLMNLDGVKKFRENKINYKKDLLEEISKTDAAEKKYAEIEKEISASKVN